MEEVSELLESQTALMGLNFIEKRSLLTLIMSGSSYYVSFFFYFFFLEANLVRGFSRIRLKGLVLGNTIMEFDLGKRFSVYETVCLLVWNYFSMYIYGKFKIHDSNG